MQNNSLHPMKTIQLENLITVAHDEMRIAYKNDNPTLRMINPLTSHVAIIFSLLVFVGARIFACAGI